jgi:lincosamide nucleotidyltransferase A/C/D/E
MAMTADAVLAVLEALGRGGVAASVAGGWAVDALLGRVTRDHGDLDLAIDTADVERAVALLGDVGFAIDADERPARLALRDGDRVVDLHPVVWAADGLGRQTGLAGEVFIYPPGSTQAVGRISGREIRCLTPELLVRFHEGYAPRPIDRQDMAALADAFDVALPAAYLPDRLAPPRPGGA